MLYYALNKYQIPEGYTFNSYINEAVENSLNSFLVIIIFSYLSFHSPTLLPFTSKQFPSFVPFSSFSIISFRISMDCHSSPPPQFSSNAAFLVSNLILIIYITSYLYWYLTIVLLFFSETKTTELICIVPS